jgi:serine phosphatase RsbU (regulator of sigma subunit)
VITAPIPLDEQERVAALRALKILDTPPEERFDRVTRLAAKLFDVPIAYVAMIDATRQWFKSKQGLKACQTPRDISFCGHAVLIDEALIVPDALADPRFADNPMVTGEPFVRFYAGQSLKSPDGRRVGTLCVVDRKPRDFSAQDHSILRELADMIERELGLVDIIKLQNEFLNTKQKLIESRAALAREMTEASAYVASLIPPPESDGPIRTDWIYLPSSELGGDAIGYHALSGADGASCGAKTALYLLDVAGHGVGAALLATTIISVLRTNALKGTDFCDPSAVLKSLNATFPMEDHGGRCFSIWYGVYDTAARSLAYSCAGHPPAFLVEPGKPVRYLDKGGISIGMIPNADYESERVLVPRGTVLGICSDGAYEFKDSSGEELGWDAWAEIFAAKLSKDRGAAGTLDAPAGGLMDRLRGLRGDSDFPDDISILTAHFE